MAEAILDLRLDTVQPNRVRLVYGVQNDYNSRYICARFTASGTPIALEKAAAVRINAKRPDGKKNAFPGTVNADGTAKVPVAQWILDVPGEVSASITAVTTNGALTTQEFYIMAKASLWDSTGEPDPENPDKDVIQTIIASENERVIAEAERVANESARKSAETARADAETQRLANESARVESETERASAESERKTGFAEMMKTFENLGGVEVSKEEPTNPNIDVWIDPDDKEGENFLTEADIAQGLGDRADMVLSQKAGSDYVADLLFTKLNKRVGKNLFDKNAVTSGYFDDNGDLIAHSAYFVSDFIPVEPSTEYTVSVYAGAGNNVFYTSSLAVISTFVQNELTASNGVFTTPENCAYIRVSTHSTIIAELQIEKGNEKTEYEEYTEYVPLRDVEKIANNNAQNIEEKCLKKIIGKNLFNKETITSGVYLDGNGVIESSEDYFVSDFIAVSPETQYVIKRPTSSAAYCWFYDENKKGISGIQCLALVDNGGVFTTPENTAYFRFSATFTHIDSQQLEAGSVSTGYETYTDNAPVTKAQNDIFNLKDAKLSKIIGKNLFDKSKVTEGYFLNIFGNMNAHSNYAISDFIRVEPYASYAITGLIGGGASHCFYNKEKKWVGYIDDSELVNTYGGILTIPGGAYYVRMSIDVRHLNFFQVEKGTEKTAYEAYTEYVPLATMEKEVSALKAQLSKTAKNPVLSATAETLNDGEYINLANNIDIKKNYTQTFFAKITSFNGVQVGHGETDFNAYYAIVDNTNITVYKWTGDIAKQQAHGLTIADYIYVVINKIGASNANIIVTTSAGSYTLSSVSWGGDNGTIHAKSIGSALTECTLNWTCADLKFDIWVFGDSYLGLTDPARFPSRLLQYGYKNWLACGASGASSAKEYDAFTKLLELGTPKYAVWCLGMNNPDSGAINASYLTNTQAFIAKCEENGIIPIISTIPSCWGSTAEDSDITVTRDNSYKTAWVRSSGYRYIDFADAVEQAGGGWYDNMLSTDGVHPTQLGAVTLANRFIRDFPEICTTM